MGTGMVGDRHDRNVPAVLSGWVRPTHTHQRIAATSSAAPSGMWPAAMQTSAVHTGAAKLPIWGARKPSAAVTKNAAMRACVPACPVAAQSAKVTIAAGQSAPVRRSTSRAVRAPDVPRMPESGSNDLVGAAMGGTSSSGAASAGCESSSTSRTSPARLRRPCRGLPSAGRICAANSAALGVRASGSGSRASSRASAARTSMESLSAQGSGAPASTSSRLRAGVSALKGEKPHRASYITAAKANTSVRTSTSPPSACSGGIYPIVPPRAPE